MGAFSEGREADGKREFLVSPFRLRPKTARKERGIICPLPGRGGLARYFRIKTITLSDEAYARIEAAKCVLGESESEVVLRALPSKAAETVAANGWRRFACVSEAEREELRRIAGLIEAEFERVEPEDCA